MPPMASLIRYDSAIPEAKVLQSWDKIARALCSRWNVFAVDLQNEPHASSWAKDPATDWNKAAERIGNHVLTQCPRWLIMVEGVGYKLIASTDCMRLREIE